MMGYNRYWRYPNGPRQQIYGMSTLNRKINPNESVRPESDYSRPTKRDPRGMRTGYTTGTTAAAAAKAAVILMLSGKAPDEVSVPLPGGTRLRDAESDTTVGRWSLPKVSVAPS